MPKHSKKNSHRSSFYRLIAASLGVTGVSSLLLPYLAIAQTVIVPPATLSGTTIKNRASGTYEDPNNPGVQINATSNEVTVTVAEVAGITAIPNGISDSTSGTPVLPNDQLTYKFLITNVGNDTTSVQIPAPVVTGPATLAAALITYDIDANADGTFETLGTNLTAAQAAILNVNGKIRVNVPVVVAQSATSGAPIKVQLGDTGSNDNSAGTQNQPVNAPLTDLRTVDAVGETNGAPVGGEKEASAIQEILVGATPQAFAAVLKTVTGSAPGPNPSPDFSDDLITYGLSLRVDSAGPSGSSASLTPTDLIGTTISVAGINSGNPITTILVSDAIPTNTVLNSLPTAPAGWTVVYSSTPITPTANPLSSSNWTTTAPGTTAEFNAVTRIGFVKNLDGATNATAPIAKGSVVTGFAFTVRTAGVPNTGGSIYNIAQLFGSSVGGATVVYDESGDQTPSNFNDDGTTGPGITNGVAAPATDGVDSNNNNTGTGVGGEDNVFTLAPPGAILNGPNGTPAAVGPTDNNDDFTNRSTNIPVGTNPGAVIDPEAITFTNTLNAPTTELNNVLLRPVRPADPTAIPNGTLVTLTFGAQTATYEYQFNATTPTDSLFVFQSGIAIQIPNIPANSSVNYTAVIDLPANTPLSTDRTTADKGFPVPILAFSDADVDGVLDPTEVNNTTINRVYTGFLKLIKRSQILKGTGPDVVSGDETLSESDKTPSPGNIIRYAIEYTNVSTLPVGAGNVLLDASKVVITDDGTGTTGGQSANNWGAQIGTVIFTSHVVGEAKDSGVGSVITFFAGATGVTPVTEQTGTTQATDITKYVNTLSVPVGPGVVRTFEFQRKVN